ncbi:hypothetical protein B10328_12360 [Campylobacter coli]|nr:hypothetical protein B10328_12360 [Campylobacter coli]
MITYEKIPKSIYKNKIISQKSNTYKNTPSHIKNIIPKKTNKNKAKVPKNNLERSLAQKII